MKFFLLLISCFASFALFAQPDSIRKIEPHRETSFDNYDLLVIGILFFLVLVGLYFWYRRKQNRV